MSKTTYWVKLKGDDRAMLCELSEVDFQNLKQGGLIYITRINKDGSQRTSVINTTEIARIDEADPNVTL